MYGIRYEPEEFWQNSDCLLTTSFQIHLQALSESVNGVHLIFFSIRIIELYLNFMHRNVKEHQLIKSQRHKIECMASVMNFNTFGKQWLFLDQIISNSSPHFVWNCNRVYLKYMFLLKSYVHKKCNGNCFFKCITNSVYIFKY